MRNEIGLVIQKFMKSQQKERIEKLAILNQLAKKGQILLTGSSLMEQFPINELLMTNEIESVIYNRGVGGFTTEDMLENMETMIFGVQPSKIFINIGTNDIAQVDFSMEKLLENYEKILLQIQSKLPNTKVYVMAYYPVNEIDKIPEGEWGKQLFTNRNNATIKIVNTEVEKLAKRLGYDFINVNAGLTDETGKLKKEFTVEGVHMYANAYEAILRNMRQYF